MIWSDDPDSNVYSIRTPSGSIIFDDPDTGEYIFTYRQCKPTLTKIEIELFIQESMIERTGWNDIEGNPFYVQVLPGPVNATASDLVTESATAACSHDSVRRYR